MRFDKWLKWVLIAGYSGFFLSILVFFVFLIPAVMYGQTSLPQGGGPIFELMRQINMANAPMVSSTSAMAIMVALLIPFFIAAFMEVAEILYSRKKGLEKLAWLAGLFFLTLFIPAIYYFVGRSELTD